jgi:NAD+ synthase
VQKTPTADLESLCPMKPDEEAFGLTYQVIDDFLEGCPVRAEDAGRIIAAYEATAHKRTGPLVPT